MTFGDDSTWKVVVKDVREAKELPLGAAGAVNRLLLVLHFPAATIWKAIDPVGCLFVQPAASRHGDQPPV